MEEERMKVKARQSKVTDESEEGETDGGNEEDEKGMRRGSNS